MQLGSPASPLMDLSGMGDSTRDSPAANLSGAGSESSELSRKTSFPPESDTEQLPSPSSLQTECAWTTGPYLEGFSFPNPYSWGQESQDKGESPADCDVGHCASQNSLSVSHSPAVPSPAQELSRRKSSEEDKPWTVSQERVSGGGDSTAGDHMWGLDGPGPAGHAQLRSRRQLLIPEVQEALPSDPAGDRPCPSSGESSWHRLGGRGGEPARLSLYVHCIQGLVLSLLAEEQLRHDRGSAEDVVSGKESSAPLQLPWRGAQLRMVLPVPPSPARSCAGLRARQPRCVGAVGALAERGQARLAGSSRCCCCCLAVPAPEQSVWV